MPEGSPTHEHHGGARLPDPRALLLCYASWYGVVWVESPNVLCTLLVCQTVLFVALGGLTERWARLLVPCIVFGALLSAIGVLVAGETSRTLIPLWAKWGTLILASLCTAMVLPPREAFIALRWFHLPRPFVLSLWVCIKALPLVVENARMTSLALRARGITPGHGLRRLWGGPRFLLQLMVPTLVSVLKRGEQMWFAIELRGPERMLTVRQDGRHSRAATLLVLSMIPVPLVLAFVY